MFLDDHGYFFVEQNQTVVIDILRVLSKVNLKSPAALFEYRQRGNRQKIRSFLDRTCLFEQPHNELLFSTWDTVAALCDVCAGVYA